MIARVQAIEGVLEHIGDNDLVVSTTGMISREVFATRDRPGNFYMIGSMGLASSLGLGLALLCPTRRVVVLEGDGSALMSLGALALIASEAPENLLHIVLDNEAYESTGGQPSITSSVRIADVGRAVGYRSADLVRDLDGIRSALSEYSGSAGPRLLLIKVGIAPVEGIARVSHSPTEIRERFKHEVEMEMKVQC